MSKLKQLHYLLGHLNYQAIKAIDCKGLINGITLFKKELSITPPICASCAKGKATRVSFPASKSRHADEILGLVHSDLWGPAPVQTITGTQYVITFTDNKSCWVWVTFITFLKHDHGNTILHLLMHHPLVPLNQQREVMLHIFKRLDRPILSPFLVALAQSQRGSTC
jgi:hypothetical protein